MTFSLCAFFALLVIAGIGIYVYKRRTLARDKFRLAGDVGGGAGGGVEAAAAAAESSQDYQVRTPFRRPRTSRCRWFMLTFTAYLASLAPFLPLSEMLLNLKLLCCE